MDFFYFHRLSEGEHRLIHFAGDKLSPRSMFDSEPTPVWLENDDARKFSANFINQPDLSFDELKNHLIDRDSEKSEPLTIFESMMHGYFQMIENDDPAIAPFQRAHAQKQIDEFLAFNKRRNEQRIESRDQLDDLYSKDVEPTVIDKTLGGAKTMLSTCSEGFMNADGKDKLIMLAGITASFFFIRALYNKNSGSKFVKRAKGLGTLALGLGVGWMTFEAVNKITEKTYGAPLVSWRKGVPESPVFSLDSKKNWKEIRESGDLDRAYKNLDDNIPDELIKKIGLEGNKKYAICISGLAKMDAGEFLNMYEKYLGQNRIPDDEYPKITDNDLLNAAERFTLVQNVGKTLGLIDKDGAPVPPKKPEDFSKSLLDMMFDWEI
jgi:hypothetical protein